MTRYLRQWTVRSSSNSNKQYTVSLTHDGEYQCSCPQWIYKRLECKHIRSVRRPTAVRYVEPEPMRPVNGISIWDNGLDE